MIRSIFICFFFCSSALVYAQDFDYEMPQPWMAKPELHTVHAGFDSSGAVGILDERKIEFVKAKDALYIEETKHSVIKIISDNGIESYNKIYIPKYGSGNITSIKARTILPDGKIINVKDDDIKEIEEDGRTYKLFAMDGLVKNAEVEYMYTEQRPLSLFGSEIFQKSSTPVEEVKFLLITPEYLKFDVAGYNGLQISTDSVIGETRRVAAYAKDVPQMEDEKYAFTDPFLMRLDYKLSYNLSKQESVRLYTWTDYAKQVYPYYTKRTSKEEKALDNYLKKFELPENKSTAEKILAIEDYIKTTIHVDEDLISDDATNMEYIVKNKATDKNGIMRLYAGVFDRYGINYQIVFPGTRTGFTLDEHLENWNRADDAIFYFPQTKKYIDPNSIELRYPFIPFQYTNVKGLFLKGTTIGDLTTAVGSFGMVNEETYDQNSINMDADVSFDAGMDSLKVHSSQVLRGYGATQYRPIYAFLPPDKQEQANKEIVKAVAGDEDIQNIKVENPELTNYLSNKPLIISADITSSKMLERAGNKILFKIGDIIGTQEQMYQEKPRKLPMDLGFPHMLDRKIVVHIPDGYSIKNPNDININVTYKTSDDDDEPTIGFVSTYTLSGNVLTINIHEFYQKPQLPLSEFDHFKNVINASADFNKVTLLLEKK